MAVIRNNIGCICGKGTIYKLVIVMVGSKKDCMACEGALSIRPHSPARSTDQHPINDPSPPSPFGRNHGVGSTDHFQEPAVFTMIHYYFHSHFIYLDK